MPKNADQMIKGQQPVAVAPNPQTICPHCQAQGTVITAQAKVKQGISGGKVTAMILTVGISLIFTGLAKKVVVTQCSCTNCGMKWQV